MKKEGRENIIFEFFFSGELRKENVHFTWRGRLITAGSN